MAEVTYFMELQLEEFEDNQRSNQSLQIEGQATQWPKEKGQNEKQRFTKHCT